MARVLIVEDYPTLAKVMAIAIQREGHAVVRVGSIGRAREVEGHFDAAIVDIDLPDGNGADFAEELLRSGRVARIIFYTSTRRKVLRDRAEAIGPVIDKEDGVDELVTTLRRPSEAPPSGVAQSAPEADAPGTVARAVGDEESPLPSSKVSGTRLAARKD